MNEALERLRIKTDRELSILAEKQLEQAMRLAELGRYRDAMRGYDTARRILAVADLAPAQRIRLERRLAAVGEAIEQPATACA